ncbi:LPS-assembly protein LptD [Colwellia sp. MB02u-14]|uniref:LPS-assembly protein LptD n=1 Tax=Colwellia sp. MB02u-14 TaxID=2759815 RepID=UPI0015F364C6|nr:LPS assembly protein LptD [Colwellia sp. MB02u-14]MBA6302469.1 LPS assembly protein LptD [Colwellia sp. MB02u-14]
MSFPRYLILIIACLSIAKYSFAEQVTHILDDMAQCPIPIYPQLTEPQSIENSKAITILAEKTGINKNKVAKFTGNVMLLNNQQTVLANEVELNRENSTINATGDIHFQNKGIDIFADQLNISETLSATTLHNTQYQLTGAAGHGGAGVIAVSKEGTLSLIDSSFTTCYGASPDWQMNASEINISKNENYLEAYHARFSVFNVPVLYLPYFTIPIGDERQSGFLYPEIGSSGKSGFTTSIPYYWNIAPNIDATITPKYMLKRGNQLITEFRYLYDEQQGQFDLEYLDQDNKQEQSSDARYLVRMQHVGTFSERFRAYIDYTAISDDNYLADIGSKHYNDNDAYLYQTGELAYFADSWQAKVKLQDFEVLGDNQTNYKALAQLELNSHQEIDLLDGLFDVYSEMTNFDTADETLPTAKRYHVEAGFTFPMVTPEWFLNSEFKLLQTHYEQDNIPVDSKLEESVSRTLPKVRFHGGVNFDRQTRFWGRGFTQTLEPQLQYLYIPEKDQSNIGVYDTTPLQDDYNGLFRDKRFSGLDRIAQANQYSWGVTSRLLDSTNQEQFRLSLGRIVYLNDSNFTLDENQGIVADTSALAAEVYARINRKWQFSSDIQYNTEDDVTNKSQTSIDYLFGKNQTIQLNHRYTRDVSGMTLEQLSLAGNVRINKNWQVITRITQDLQQNRSIETYAGLQYQSCCWSLSFAYHRYITANFDETSGNNENRDEFNNGFMIRFSMRTKDITDMFNSSIFGYKRPYFLNN